MAPDRINVRWLQPFLAVVALAGLLSLGGCGGGSGAPNNPFAPPPPTIGPVFVLPATMSAYAHTPTTLTVSGGQAPYSAFSSNTAVLPLAQAVSGTTIVLLPNDAPADTVVTVTVQDAIGQTATSTVTVHPAPIFGTLTITPANPACPGGSGSGSGSGSTPTNVVCSGDTASATVQVMGATGAGVANRQVRFDVVSGAFSIKTSNPAQPLVSTLTVVSDANGNATVVLQAAVGAPSQPAQLRATDITTGNAVTGVFTIVQSTNGSAILSVVPATATITGPDASTCTTGFRIDYYIYGGTPPYSVSSTFPTAVTVVNPIVTTSGGFFEAVTKGTCVNPLVFTIADATGLQTTAQLINQVGTSTTTPPSSPLVLAPLSYTVGPGANTCTGKSFNFVISGGTPPFSVAGAGATVVPNPVTTSPGSFSVSGFSDGSGAHSIFIGDASKPQLTSTVTVTCN